MNITDSHCHLDEDRFAPDREEVVARALDAGVNRMVSVGTDIESDKKVVALAQKYPSVYAAVGIHPNDSVAAVESDFQRLRELARHSKVVAIGETGLDFYRETAPREAQVNAFQRHLDTARSCRLPVVIHTRQSTAETLEILTQWAKQSGVPSQSPGVIHCFSGDWQTARKFLDLGFYLSFGGYIGYPNGHALTVIRQVPVDRLLVETDAPFLPPQPYRGKRNEPAYIVHTLGIMAQALDKPPEEMAEITTNNAKALFEFL